MRPGIREYAYGVVIALLCYLIVSLAIVTWGR